ncbi:NAD(P)-binding protein [Xylariomycetidae sp. FL0641]|nr:NAD(P)-binding protein [Xylariomycetidae sp. FL0641]
MASPTPKTMRAWQYTNASAGLENSLTLNPSAPRPDATSPLPGTGILVRVHASALNPADYKLAELGLLSRAVVRVPASPGMDFAGTVEAVGSSLVDSGGEEEFEFAPGTRVFGRVAPGAQHGTLAEYVVVADGPAGGLARLPDGVAMADAAALGTAALTAYQCLLAGGAARGDRVFVNGGSGGTGVYGVQMAARALGCRVVASCSGRNAALCQELGAEAVLDYTTTDVGAALRGMGPVFTAVVDNVGTSPADLHRAADACLAPGGRYVQVGGGAGLADLRTLAARALLPAALGGMRHPFQFLMTRNDAEHLRLFAQWMQEGKIRAVVDEVFEYADAPKAFAKLKGGRVRGKLVVKGAPPAEK